MKVFGIFSVVFFLFLGTMSIVQTEQYNSAIEHGQDVQVIVLKKTIGRLGAKELKVSFNQKLYWVKVKEKTFTASVFNKPLSLRYDDETDLIIDPDFKKNDYLAGAFFIIFAFFYGWKIIKK